MTSSGKLFFWLLNCILLLLTKADDGHPIRGVPGIDYPNYQTIPHTSFRCSEQQLIPGLYADPETGCQMFHHCYEHRHESFLCPPGTIFNQAILACDYWYSADCSAATSHFNLKSQHKASNNDPKIELAPNKNPSINIFNKLASLYEVKEPLSFDYASEEETYNSVSENYQVYDNNILTVPGIHDRREGVITETNNDHSYYPYGNQKGDQLGLLDDFESSGESDDFEEQENYEEEFSSLNDSERNVVFEKPYFGYEEVKDFEYDSRHQLNNEELLPHFFGIQNKSENSSKDHKSEDTFVKRQSKPIENSNIRKQRRRKPIYTIPKDEAKEFTATEIPQHKIDLNVNNNTDSLNYSQESVTTSNSVSTSSTSKTKRRKPVLIQLEDSYEYNVDKAKISSIKYGNPQSNIPEFSMDAEEISVKLFPSDTERKPVDRLIQHQFTDKNSNGEIRSLNIIASHGSNIFHTSTLSALDDIESFSDISMNHVYPKRKRNTIRVIDSEDNHDISLENNELKEATTFLSEFEDHFTTQSTRENFKDYDKYDEPHFGSQDVEKARKMADVNPELERQLEDNHDVFAKIEEFEDTKTFTPSYEDEFTTQSISTTFGNFDEFPELHFQDHELENAREMEHGLLDIVIQTEEDHDADIENEEINDVTTLTSIIDDEFTTHSSNTNFKDFDKIFYPTSDGHNIEIDQEIENGHSNLVLEHNEDSYSNFITPYPHIEMIDRSEDTHLNQMNPRVTLDLEEYKNEEYLEYISNFPKYISFKDIDMNDDKEKEYSFTTTDISIPEMSSEVPISEGESNRFYFNPIIESTFDDSDTSESLSHQVLETSNEDNFTIPSKPFSKHTNETETNARVDIEVGPLINTDINQYLINENSKDKLNADLQKIIHTEASVHAEENSSSIDSSEEHYDSHNTLSVINSKETDFSQIGNESNIETIEHKLEFVQNIHQSDEPIDSGILDKVELERVENMDNITETSSFEDSEIDSEDISKILDDLENYHNVAKNDSISDQEHVFNPKHDSDGKTKLEDPSKITPGKAISNIETNTMNKGFSKLPQNNPGNIMKDKPVRIPRMFMPPYSRDFNLDRFSRDFNFEKLGSQNFAGVPYSMLKFKQKSMNKLLGSSTSIDGYGMKGIEDYFSSRTGDFLDSPKISKLISIGKNLLNAKKAKLRILRNYVNY